MSWGWSAAGAFLVLRLVIRIALIIVAHRRQRALEDRKPYTRGWRP